MKPKFKARELLWMIAPVVLLGGAAWWYNDQAKLRSGPPRLLPLQWERVPVSPSDVAQGYDFAVRTRVSLMGDVRIPPKFARFSPDYIFEPHRFHLQYRRAQGWKNAVFPKKEWPYAFIIGDNNFIVRFRLASVPHDAQEVRARGVFIAKQSFQAPSSWTPSSGYFKSINHGSGPFRLWVASAQQSFDIPIKRANEAFPSPQVSRESGFEFVEAKWFSSAAQDQIVVRVRKRPLRGISQDLNLSLLDYQLLDADGHRIHLFDNNGTGHELIPAGFGMRNRSSLGVQLPLDEDVFNVVWAEAPRGGWKTVKTPISLHLRLSRENLYPLDISAQLKPEPLNISIYSQ